MSAPDAFPPPCPWSALESPPNAEVVASPSLQPALNEQPVWYSSGRRSLLPTAVSPAPTSHRTGGQGGG